MRNRIQSLSRKVSSPSRKTIALAALACALMVAGSSAARAYYFSSWGQTVYPVGSDQSLHTYWSSGSAPGVGGYQNNWFRGNTGTGSPGGNTWAMVGGYCYSGSNSVWVASPWNPPSSNLMAGYVSCPTDRPTAYSGQGFSRVASDGFSNFNY